MAMHSENSNSNPRLSSGAMANVSGSVAGIRNDSTFGEVVPWPVPDSRTRRRWTRCHRRNGPGGAHRARSNRADELGRGVGESEADGSGCDGWTDFLVE